MSTQYVAPTHRRTPGRAARRGAATVELAVLLPFLVFILVIATDWARLMYFTMCLNDAARSGALYASDEETRMKSRHATVKDAALAECPDIAASATVTSSQATDAGGRTYAVVEVSMPFKTITNFPGVPSAETLTRESRMKVAPLMTR